MMNYKSTREFLKDRNARMGKSRLGAFVTIRYGVIIGDKLLLQFLFIGDSVTWFQAQGNYIFFVEFRFCKNNQIVHVIEILDKWNSVYSQDKLTFGIVVLIVQAS